MKVFLAVLTLIVTGLATPARADSTLPTELEGIGIEDKHGARLPTELTFRDHTGSEVKLGDYLDGKPLIVVLAYYQCPMLCSYVLNGITDAVRELDFGMGEGFRMLTVSFDPRDTAPLALAKRENYLRAYGKPTTGTRPWDFLLDQAGSAQKLADTVGFHYRWDEATGQYAHAAGIFVFTPDGRLSRVLYGMQWKPRDLRFTLIEASAGRLGSAWDQVLLFCFHYDPSAKGYILAATRIMRYFGGIFVLGLGYGLLRLWRRERGKPRAEQVPV